MVMSGSLANEPEQLSWFALKQATRRGPLKRFSMAAKADWTDASLVTSHSNAST
jgi:hypothetical protein